MKQKIWKLYFFDLDGHDTKEDVFNQTEILSEKELHARFKQAINDEQFCGNTFDEYDLFTKDADSFTTEEIVEIFDYDGYTIQQTFIEI